MSVLFFLFFLLLYIAILFDMQNENIESFKVTNKIPLENFYIHELADNYNLKMDYVNWARAQVSCSVV